MQKIERYGVIALVFMAVSVVAVYLWDDRDPGRSNGENRVAAFTERAESRATEAPRTSGHRQAPLRPSVDLPMSVDAQGGTRQQPEAAPLNPRAGSTRAEVESVPSALPGRVERSLEESTIERPQSQAARRPMVALDVPNSTPTLRGREPERRNAQPLTRDEVPEIETRGARQPEQGRRYVVVAGDSLERIARRELGDASLWPELQSFNQISDPQRIRAGQVLKLPAAGETRATLEAAPVEARKEAAPSKPKATAAEAPRLAAGTRTYVIKKGDVLGTIAQRELGSAKLIAKIKELNPGLDPDRILVGAKLMLPPGPEGTRPSLPIEIAKPDQRVASASAARPRENESRASDSPYRVR
jgi:nucleoid-associated protein YgaU